MSETSPSADPRAARSVKRGSLLVAALILSSLCWYLAADRLTPYTRQARVQGFVVGVAPRVSGLVTEVWVRNDQRVAAGDPLFQVDPTDYEIALARARAGLADSRARLAAAEAEVETARSRLDAALASLEKARKDAERQQRLHRKDPGAISVRRVEIALATLEEARARVAGARADLKKAREQARGAREKLAAARSEVQKAELDLAHTRVTAGTAGVVTDLRTDTGHYAKKGQPVLTLVATHDLWIQAQYTENNLGHLAPGTPVVFVLDALPGKLFRGEVASIGQGVRGGAEARAGRLPAIANSRNWLRPAQRFPVVIRFDRDQAGLDPTMLRVGGQAEVMAFTGEAGLLAPLGRLFMRVMSWLSYVY